MLPGYAVGVIRSVVRSPITVWIAFILVHLWLGLVNLYAPSAPLGDVTYVYKFWTDQATQAHFWVGIDSVWVYPILAIVPMLAAAAFGPEQHGSTWLTIILLLNAVAFGFVTGWGRARERIAVAWWWVGFLLLLGPIALGRIDSVTIPLALVGVLLIATRPRAAAVILAVGMWVKVWPAALVGAALIALRDRARILGVVLVVSGAIIVVALFLGSGLNVLSFVTQQTGRGVQVEAPVATFWLWRALAGAGGGYVYYDQEILTYQVRGDGIDVAAAVMTPLLAVIVIAVVVLGVRATRAGASSGDLFPALSLALVTTLIAVNKVGSPQFISWLAAPIILGLIGYPETWRRPAALALVMAGLTQLIYPYFYNGLLTGSATMVLVLTVRNLLELVLLTWMVLRLVRLGSGTGQPFVRSDPSTHRSILKE